MKKVINIRHEDCWLPGKTDAEEKTELVKVEPGLRVILYSERYVGPSNCHAKNGDEHYYLMDYSSHTDGVPGNLDPNCRALEGWRGTTDDWSCHAYGVWDVVSVGESRQWEERPELKYGFRGVRKVRVELVKVEVKREEA